MGDIQDDGGKQVGISGVGGSSYNHHIAPRKSFEEMIRDAEQREELGSWTPEDEADAFKEGELKGFERIL